ncbi:MAG TPA: S53 family peptidase [Caulobacteraceae bacterium]|jgi:subtilase family serine protease
MTIHSKLALAAGIAAFVAASGASAQQFRALGQVEHSGHTFHAKVCPGFEGPMSARCFAHVVTDAAGNIQTSNATRNATPAGFGSATLRAAYGITGMGSSSTIVAIVDAYGYPNAASDLAVYRQTMGLPACTTTSGCLTIVNQTGGNRLPKTNTGWDQEQALDLDMVSSMCPNCRILLVQASSTSYANLGQAVNTAANRGALVISNSYGGGEGGTTSYEPDYNHPGVTVTASAGDSGYGAQFPATSPHVVAAGGTSLTMNGNSYLSESVWSGTGSGCSTVYNAPSWQVGTAAHSACTRRMETDVSAVADPNTGVAVYGPPGGTRSAWMVFGGTSVSAPLLGGIYGEVGANCGSTDPNNVASYCASKLYTNGVAGTGFHDVTMGSNGSCGGTYFCTAETGYDGPTGWGSPNTATAF